MDYILEKQASSPKRKKGTFFSFSRKKGHIFLFSRGTYSYATLMLMHETPKIGSVINFAIKRSFLIKPFIYKTKNSGQKCKYLKKEKSF